MTSHHLSTIRLFSHLIAIGLTGSLILFLILFPTLSPAKSASKSESKAITPKVTNTTDSTSALLSKDHPASSPPNALERALSVEKRAATEISAYLNDISNQEWITLQDGSQFLSLYQADQTGDDRGSVIILPGIQQPPVSPGILDTLRTRLPQHGWSTLCVSLPNDPELITGTFTSPASPKNAPLNAALTPSSTVPSSMVPSSTDPSVTTPSAAPSRSMPDMVTLQVPEFPTPQVLNEHMKNRLRAIAKKIQEKNAKTTNIIAFDISALWLFEALEDGLELPNLRAIVLIDGYQPSSYEKNSLIKISIKSPYPLLDIAQKYPQAIYQSGLRAIRAKQTKRENYQHLSVMDKGYLTPHDTRADQLRLTKTIQGWLRKYNQPETVP